MKKAWLKSWPKKTHYSVIYYNYFLCLDGEEGAEGNGMSSGNTHEYYTIIVLGYLAKVPPEDTHPVYFCHFVGCIFVSQVFIEEFYHIW